MQSRPFFLAPCPPYLGLPAAPPLTQQRDDSRPVSTFAVVVRDHREERRYENKLGFNQCRKSISGRCVRFGKIRHETGKLCFLGSFLLWFFVHFLLSFLPVLWALMKAQAIKTGWKHNLDSVSVKKYFFFTERPLVFCAIFIKGLFGGILERLSQTTHWYSKWVPVVL